MRHLERTSCRCCGSVRSGKLHRPAIPAVIPPRSSGDFAVTQQIPILSVSELSRLLKSHIEDSFGLLAIRGEVSNVSRSANGHIYLTLKDQTAQLRAVLWRDTARALKFQLKDGLDVIAVGGSIFTQPGGPISWLSMSWCHRESEPWSWRSGKCGKSWLPRGCSTQTASAPCPASRSVSRWSPVPRGQQSATCCRSSCGAGQRRILSIVPVPVQGDGAAERIARGIKLLSLLPDVDVAIVGRGGGSRKTCGHSTRKWLPVRLPTHRFRSSVLSGMKSMSVSAIWSLTIEP